MATIVLYSRGFLCALSRRRQLLLTGFRLFLFFHVLVICILVYLVFRGIDVEVFLPFLSRMWERGVTEIAVDDVCLSVSTFPLS